MHRLQTAYTVYFNLRHRRCGHLLQGRYGAVLVEGDEYLLKLSRYIHLNPVFVGGIKERSLKERLSRLHRYRWSSYQGYIGKAKPAAFVECGPLLQLAGGGRDAGRRRAYRRFVDAGLARTDEEFLTVLKEGKWGIGSEGFCNWVQDRHLALLSARKSREDVAFRKVGRWLGADEILECVTNACKVDRAYLGGRHKGDWIRPLAAKLLGKCGGKTQREVAKLLGITTGAAVSIQQRRLEGMLAEDSGLRKRAAQIEALLVVRQSEKGPVHDNLCFKG
jgi:putative transposase